MLGRRARRAGDGGAMGVGVSLSRHSDSMHDDDTGTEAVPGGLGGDGNYEEEAPAERACPSATNFFPPLVASRQTCWVMTGSSASCNVCLSCASPALLSK